MTLHKRLQKDLEIGFVKNSILDDKDKAIIEVLVKNAKTTTTDIAHKLKISDVASRRRIKRLEENKVIEFYTAIVNPYKLGYNAVVQLMIEVEPKRIEEVAEKIAELSQTVNVYAVTGKYSIIAEVWIKNHKELLRLIREIGEIEGVKSTLPLVTTKFFKINGLKVSMDMDETPQQP
ncbi:transcriptional regulator [Ignicoccus islandicus DSM 13165]|uniref:Transcriptional regulator n=1 Tax=Ignicoccus islandicus DSM 13165 TaxID=940295 RepID=A0A0U3E7T0_9CREN|nr:Lrp/AsnC family transcriptional regulator [Ignicoccus islandicus]ALU11438.1 transcriptional regulator [Ignicoccus islandicus DSM 13165]